MNTPEDRIRQMVQARRDPRLQTLPYLFGGATPPQGGVQTTPYTMGPQSGDVQTLPYHSPLAPTAPQQFQPQNPKPMPKPPVRMDDIRGTMRRLL